MAIQAQFVTEPPQEITGPFEFTVAVTNNGQFGETYSFEAVLINPATGEQATRLWSTNVWLSAGATKELTFRLAETRSLSVSDGTYDLNVLYGVYPTPTNWKSAVNTTVNLNLSGGGGSGSPPGNGDGGDGIVGGGESGSAETFWDNIANNPTPYVGGAVALVGIAYATNKGSDGIKRVPKTTRGRSSK